MSHRWFALRCYCLAAVVFFFASSVTFAVNRTWDTATNSFFDTPSNWTGGVRPDVTGIDSVTFNVFGTYEVLFDSTTDSIYSGSPSVNDVDVNSGVVSFETSALPRRTLNVTGTGGDQRVQIDGGTLSLGESGDSTRAFELVAGGRVEIFSGSLNVYQGSRLHANSFLDIGSTGDTGTLLVTGAGAEASASSGVIFWGRSGGTADVTFTDAATGSFQDVSLAGSTSADSKAVVNVSNGAQLDTGTLSLATDGGVNTSAAVTVETGGAGLTQTGTSSLTVGHASLGTASMVVQDSGTFTSGTGSTTVNSTGTITINSAGTWNANGNMVLDGGTLNRNSGGVFNLATGNSLTAQNGGQFLSFDSYDIDDGTTFSANTGGTMDFNSWLDIGDNGTDGTLNVDGATSMVSVGSISFWGSSGGTATVSVTDGASLTTSSLDVALSATAGTTATIDVLTGADMTINGNLDLVNAGGATTSGTITVDGAGSTLTQNSASSNDIGHATSGTAQITVANSGEFTTGTGTTTVHKTGTIDLSSIFNANGNIVLDGGTLNRNSGGTFNLATGLALTAQNGGQFFSLSSYDIDDGTTFTANSGGTMTFNSFLDIGDNGTDGTLNVDGPTSMVSVGSTSFWGDSGGTATVSVTNEASLTTGDLDVARSATAGTTATIDVLTGADMTINGNLDLVNAGGATTSGTITVDGAGSTLTQNSTFDNDIGHATSGTAQITVANSGEFTTGTGTTTVHKTGTIDLNLSSTFNANGNIVLDGGALNSNSGSAFNLATGLSLTAQNGGQFFSSNTYDIDDGTTFNANSGGTMTFDSFLDIGDNGTDGTLNVDGPTSMVSVVGGASFWGDSGGTAIVSVTNEASLTTGSLDVARSTTAGTTATIDVLTGADMTINGALDLVDAGGATTSGTITVDGAGSTLTQNSTFDNDIGHATSGMARIAVSNSGSVTFGTGTTSVHATGTIELNSNGVLTAPGTIAMNGGTFDFLGGTLHVANFNGDLLNQGGTLAPGTSAGSTVVIGDYTQQAGAALEIEVGGLSAGAQYDLVNITGDAFLDGDLELLIIDGFAPGMADTFTVLSAANLFGLFDNVTTGLRLSTVDGIGSFLVHYGIGSSFAQNQIWLTDFAKTYSADFDFDGDVDADDLLIWEGDHGSGNAGDADGDGDSDGADFLAWQRQNGSGVVLFLPLDAAVVPEPSSLLLCLSLSVMGMLRASRREVRQR